MSRTVIDRSYVKWLVRELAGERQTGPVRVGQGVPERGEQQRVPQLTTDQRRPEAVRFMSRWVSAQPTSG
jgi:hypothetical protein